MKYLLAKMTIFEIPTNFFYFDNWNTYKTKIVSIELN